MSAYLLRVSVSLTLIVSLTLKVCIARKPNNKLSYLFLCKNFSWYAQAINFLSGEYSLGISLIILFLLYFPLVSLCIVLINIYCCFDQRTIYLLLFKIMKHNFRCNPDVFLFYRSICRSVSFASNLLNSTRFQTVWISTIFSKIEFYVRLCFRLRFDFRNITIGSVQYDH